MRAWKFNYGLRRCSAFDLSHIAILLAGLLLLFFSEAEAQTEAIRVVFYPPWNISKLPMYLARETGVFERNGLTIAWTDPGANHIVHNNATGGAAMILIGNTGYNYSAFFAGASIKSAADLKGKKIGTGEPGSTPDQLTRLALRKLGIDPDL